MKFVVLTLVMNRIVCKKHIASVFCALAIFILAFQHYGHAVEAPAETNPEKVIQSRSSWSVFGGIGIGGNAPNAVDILKVPRTDPLGRNSPDAKRGTSSRESFVFPIHVGASYHVIDACQKTPFFSCVDVLLLGALEYQLFFISGSDLRQSSFQIQIQLGAETNVFFGSQRTVAWMTRFGLGYAYSSQDDLFNRSLDGQSDYYYANLRDVEALQNQLVFSLGTGVLFNLPKATGISLYALLGLASTLGITPDSTQVSLQSFWPNLGFRYRF